MNLIGHIDAKRKPAYLPSVDVPALKGKFILTYFGTDEIYGPFDSIEQLQEWAKERETKVTNQETAT